MDFPAFLISLKGGKRMDQRTIKINEDLYAKMESEYHAFLDDLEKRTPHEIISSSYEKVFKEDILMVLSENNLSYDRANALLHTEKPLDAAYNAWLKEDVSYMEDLSNCLEKFAEKICMERKRKELER